HKGLENSIILRDYGNNIYLQQLSSYLSPVLQDSSRSRWIRCWRAASDGWDVDSTFHQQCNNKGPTVTIVRVGSYIFGGYSDVSWDSSSAYTYSTKAFLFSLYNTYGYHPVKLLIVQHQQYAIYRYYNYGPTFGSGHDMCISNHASGRSNSNFRPYDYTIPPGCSYSNYCSFYTGNGRFTPSDIEVFYETTN
ncbi:TLD domain-containing protein 1-like, partial [Exaiptasia diaphana]|uniref:TLDc domain-containing protein n=1 Tax=Exaiptasia diaphana TaxID=2652724 RepID=A0A913YXJ7_EXADI